MPALFTNNVKRTELEQKKNRRRQVNVMETYKILGTRSIQLNAENDDKQCRMACEHVYECNLCYQPRLIAE